MHHDATNGRDFDFILCWDLSRFGRFDSIKAGRWINPLRRAGVKLFTVKDGPADWTSFEGRVMSAINSEAKHQYILGIADSAPRGMIQRTEKGHLCGQAAPYGYDRIEVDENGQQQGPASSRRSRQKPQVAHYPYPGRRSAKGQNAQVAIQDLRRNRHRARDRWSKRSTAAVCRPLEAIVGTAAAIAPLMASGGSARSARFYATKPTSGISFGPSGGSASIVASLVGPSRCGSLN